jgi:hypothetical protein
MSSSGVDPVVSLNNAVTEIYRYFATSIYIFGIVGNILNILVLSQKVLRSNPCAVLFCGSSIAGLISLISGLTPRVVSGWATDPSESIRWLCKIRGFTLFTSRAVAFWLIMLATVDRWLLSCADIRRRNLSTVKNVHRGIASVTFLSIVIHCQTLYCYEPNLVDAPGKCFSDGMICRLLNDMLLAICSILIPLLLMTVFGLMTISNVRHSRNRIHPTNISTVSHLVIFNHRQRRLNKTDRHLLIMLFVQVTLLALLTIPSCVDKLYSTLTSNVDKSRLQIAVENIIYNVTLLLVYLATGLAFYNYTLSGGTVFRKAFFDLMRLTARKLMR